MSWRVCPTPGCPELVDGGGCCEKCLREQRASSDRRRGNATDRGYGHRWRAIAKAFLAKHRWCVDCGKRATVADHDPVSRRELVRRGDPNPDAEHHLKPRCHPCHSRRTAQAEPGGWNA